MKLVINSCFGGFSLSPAGVKRYAELKGRECYFFDLDWTTETYVEPKDNSMFFCAFDIPNPNEVLKGKPWSEMTIEERKAQNDLHDKHAISTRPEPRNDPDLVRVVEELGEAANGKCAKLEIVEIPDDVEWQIEEYDGSEHVAEAHRTWR